MLESGRRNRATYTKQKDDPYEGPGSRASKASLNGLDSMKAPTVCCSLLLFLLVFLAGKT
jgi:hypothetical protein